MKQRFAFVIAHLFCICNLSATSVAKYNAMWEHVDSIWKDSTPTAQLHISEIEQLAKKEDNKVQQLRCILYRTSIVPRDTTPRSADSCIYELTKFKEATTDVALRSITACILAFQYERLKREVPNEQPDVDELFPADLKKWTDGRCDKKIEELIEEALKPSQLLLKTKAEKYEGIIILGEDSRKYAPSLYDALVYNIVNVFWYRKDDLTDRLTKYHANDPDKSAYLLAEYKRHFNYVNDTYELFRKLQKKYNKLEASNLFIPKICDGYLDERFCSTTEEIKTTDKLILDGMTKFPDYNHGELAIYNDMLHRPACKIVTDKKTISPEDSLILRVTYSNIKKPIEFWVYNTDNNKPFKKYEAALNNEHLYAAQDTILRFPPIGKCGKLYIKVAYNGELPNHDSLSVITTNLAIANYHLTGSNTSRVYAFDRNNGKPLGDVSVNMRNKYWEKDGWHSVLTKDTVTTAQGYAVLTPKTNTVIFKMGEDSLKDGVGGWYEKRVQEKYDAGTIFTDRNIYRPGQTIYYKVILCKKANKEQDPYHDYERGLQIDSNSVSYITLFDINNRKISQQSIKTNNMGSASGSFVIPEEVGTGTYHLQYKDKSLYFRVEEYKKPTFAVTLEKDDRMSYNVNDTVRITGNANYFMGTPVQKAKVHIETFIESYWACYWEEYYKDHLRTDEIETDDKGNFELKFVLRKKECPIFANLRFTVSVTDAKGETQDAQSMAAIGKYTVLLHFSTPDIMQFEDLKNIPFILNNLKGEPVAKKMTVTLMQGEKTISTQQIESHTNGNNHISINTNGLPSGNYSIMLSTTDDKNVDLHEVRNLLLYHCNDTVPPVHSPLWLSTLSDSVAVGDSMAFLLGTSFKGQHVKFFIENEFDLIHEDAIKFNGNIQTIKFPFTEKDGQKIRITAYTVHQGKHFERSVYLSKKLKPTALHLELTTFRDQTKPGAKETWILTLDEKDVNTEVLAYMYDAALDQLAGKRNKPEINKNQKEYFFNRISYSNSFESYYKWKGKYVSDDYLAKYKEWSFNKIIMQPNHPDLKKEWKLERKQDFNPLYICKISDNTHTIKTVEDACEVSFDRNKRDNEPNGIRTNFNETAFFKPHLRTDNDGRIKVEFVMPDGLTKWHFVAFGHSDGLLRTGATEKDIESKKDFMLSPNLPRFLRKGDNMVLTASVINLLTEDLEGKAVLEFVNPNDNCIITSIETDFKVEAGKTEAVEWPFEVNFDLDLVIVRMHATSGDKTDGEQHYLPVFSNRSLVTECMPMTITDNSKHTFSFQKLKDNQSETLKSELLKVEFCTNPTWYALQALPDLMKPKHDVVTEYAAAIYATKVAQNARQLPHVNNAAKHWLENDTTELQSALETNPNVKNTLLSESPWVLAALKEQKRKTEMAKLLGNYNYRRETASRLLEELKQFKFSDGAYTWTKVKKGHQRDSKEEFRTTLYVLDLICRKEEGYIAYSDNIESINFLVSYIDNMFVEKKHRYPTDHDMHADIDFDILEYFFITTHLLEKTRKSDGSLFFKKHIADNWEKRSLYEQALTAIILKHWSNDELAKQIVNSLRQQSTTVRDYGTYWNQNRGGFRWQDSPIATHAALIEAFSYIDPQTEELDMMRLWLLNQKRTSMWDNSIATAYAIETLTDNGCHWLDKDNKVSIKMADEKMSTPKTDNDLGYFTHTFIKEEVKKELADITVKKQSKNIAWGAVYWQYTEDNSKIEEAGSDITVERIFCMEKTNDKGEMVLEPITRETHVKVGDKVVMKTSIRCKHPLEYVCLKNPRPACLTPIEQMSGYYYKKNLHYYRMPKDATTNYYINRLPEGSHTITEELRVTHQGVFQSGISSLQCIYAPAFNANSKNVSLTVK